MLKTFFRRIEQVGRHHLPATGPAIFVLNHPNGLLDPLFILAFGPRSVSFMAKEPLFHTPIVRHFVKAFDCLPVYRKVDGADPKQNARSMQAARELLARNGSLALFPEGMTHAEPDLQPLKTGAARIALSARASMRRNGQSTAAVALIPVGLFYRSRGTFRSDAAVIFGEPVDVALVSLDENDEPPRDAVGDLTARIDAELRGLTVNASSAEHITLAATAARLLEEAPGASGQAHPGMRPGGALSRRMELMQRILARYEEDREGAQSLVGRLRSYHALMARHGVTDPVPSTLGLGQAARHLGRTLLGMAVLLPAVVAGLIENFLVYRLVDILAQRASRGHGEVVSTLKVLAGFLLFPITWLAVSIGAWMLWDWRWAVVHLVLAPFCARAALWFLDRVSDTVAGARVLWMIWVRRGSYARLVSERDAIAAELLGLAAAAQEPGRPE